MSALAEIKAAAALLPLEQQEELYRVLGARLHPGNFARRGARLVRDRNDALLEAPSDAPAMTSEKVKEMLGQWP